MGKISKKIFMSSFITRRRFVRQLTAAGAALSFPAILRAEAERKALRVAFIATGGIGGAHISEIAKLGVGCPCFCDVDSSRYGEAAKKWPNARPYQDYRRMFEKEAKNFDAVMIGTPDHHHYPATILAMQHRKHVYTQKPLTQTIWEARQLTEAARRYKVATQMGNQGTANEGVRLCYEWIHSEWLGAISEVHVWTNRPVWPQALDRPEGADEIPASLDWDAWLGPAPARPFKKDAYHPFNWRGWFDFGAGALGDMACHTMNAVFFALDPGNPTSVEAVEVEDLRAETFPKGSVVKWEFPAKGARAAFTLFWYEGSKKPPRPPELEADRKMPDSGALFVGTKGKLLVWGDYNDKPRVIPAAREQELGAPPKLLERSVGHYKEWVLAAQGEKPLDFPKANFAYAGPFTETILLGNVAVRAGKRLEWDGQRLRFRNDRDANRLVSKTYRKGWKF